MKKQSNQSVDFSGNPSSRVSRAGVVVSHLDDASPALHGFPGTIDWAGQLIVGNDVHRRPVQDSIMAYSLCPGIRVRAERRPGPRSLDP